MQTLHGTQHPAAKTHLDIGRLPSGAFIEGVTLLFRRSQQQQADLDTLLAQQQDPNSANYHKFLTPLEYQARFGISPSDLAKVKSWITSQGLSIDEKSTSATAVLFSGPAAYVEKALHTELHSYQAGDEVHFANATDISVPAAIADVVAGVSSLNDFHPRPRVRKKLVHPAFTSSISGSHFMAPDDLATIYDIKPLYNAGFTGAGQKIAIVGQSDISIADIRAFRAASNLFVNDPQVILTTTKDPGVVKGDADEAALDVEWSGAVAPDATIIYINSNNGAFASLHYAILNNVAPIISVSYGDCENPTRTTGNLGFTKAEADQEQAFFQQASTQGQTVIVASGDSGAADCDYPTGSNKVTVATHGLSVDFPSSSPNVTAVGGSTFNEGGNPSAFWNTSNNLNNGSVISYIPEVSWNDTADSIANGGSLEASGGGVSSLFSKPSWQVGAGVPSDTQRDLPDITFSASSSHDGYLLCSQGSCVNGYRAADTTLTVVGGTSAGAPSFAGLVALLNQKAGSSQGNVNPAVYALAASTSSAFHDIVSGDNKVPCQNGTSSCPNGGSIGYLAGPGYDLVTGLGSLDGAKFVNGLTPLAPPPPADFQLSAVTTSLTVTRGKSTSDNVTVTALNGFAGNVALSCSASAALTNTACSFSPASVSGSGTVSLTVTASQVASARIPGGPYQHSSPMFAFSLLALFGVCFAGDVKRRNLKKAAAMGMILALAFMMAACGGGGGGATPVPSTTPTTTIIAPVGGVITITATSGSITHTAQIAVTVN